MNSTRHSHWVSSYFVILKEIVILYTKYGYIPLLKWASKPRGVRVKTRYHWGTIYQFMQINEITLFQETEMEMPHAKVFYSTTDIHLFATQCAESQALMRDIIVLGNKKTDDSATPDEVRKFFTSALEKTIDIGLLSTVHGLYYQVLNPNYVSGTDNYFETRILIMDSEALKEAWEYEQEINATKRTTANLSFEVWKTGSGNKLMFERTDWR